MNRNSALATILATITALGFATAPVFAGRAAGLQFHVQAQSWISPQSGWLLGSASCGTSTCTEAIHTSDGGRTWQVVGTLPAPLTNEDPAGVTEIRFADALHGWAFKPALWATSDGGATWQEQAVPGGTGVAALAADASVAYAVFPGCTLDVGLLDCRRGATLWSAVPGAGTWTQVSLKLPVSYQASLAVHDAAAYVVIPSFDSTRADVIDVTLDGQRWASRSDPCSKRDGEYLSDIAAVSSTNVVMLCQANIGFGKAGKRVFRSTDGAATTTSAGALPEYGINSRVDGAPNGTILVASDSIGSWIYRNAGGQTWTTPEDLGDGGLGWNDIAFTSNDTAFVVHGPAGCCGGNGPGELWKSTDGGVTWRQTVVAPKG
jgi:hypothetical protein